MLKNAKILFIIFLMIILIISIWGYFDISDFQNLLDILGRYILMIISLTGGGIITYHFFKAIFDKHKKRKLICCSLTVIAMIIGISIYILTHRPTKVVYMKEDVLYILPKSQIQSNPDDIYDGSINDPNLKQDTI
jgi:predicted Na+-dependent transporter